MKNRTVKYLLFFAIAAATAFGIYRYAVPDKYEYWNNLIAKDPKPDGVSEKEYREKLRAGYCWRDRKFYTAEELQQKAMVSFSGRLLGEAKTYWSDSTYDLVGKVRTSEDCARDEKACRVWFVPQDYTNEQWDKLFLAEKDPTERKLLLKYLDKEVKHPFDLQKYLTQFRGGGFTLVFKEPKHESIFGSDCCKILTNKDLEAMTKNKYSISHIEVESIFHESSIPEKITIQDYGIGNFYLEPKSIIAGVHRLKENNKSTSSDLFLLNNCGDVLWYPFYYVYVPKKD